MTNKDGETSMKSIDMDSMADIVFQLRWDSRDASHNECYAARGVNLWRDWLPEKVNRALLGRHALDKLTLGFAPDELFGNNGGPIKVDRQRFAMEPKAGRFYPRGRLSGLPGVFPQNMQPLRCTAVNNGHMEVDLSHPLASYALHLTMTIGQVSTKAYERGGSSVDWVGLLTDGPGMQVRWNDTPTEFFSDRSFQRSNDQPDDRFYEKPRLVHHLDHTAEEMVSDLYRRFVKNGSRVLDLMSSWASHLPEDVATARVSGVGMNRTQLEQNEKLNDVVKSLKVL